MREARTTSLDEEKCEEGAPAWVVTFGDMMSLLLTFFILLLSFAQLEILKYKVFSGSVLVAFGVQTVTPAYTPPQADNVLATEFSMEFSHQEVFQALKATVERHRSRTPAGLVDVEVFEDYRGIVVRLGEEAMFETGRADVRPAAWPFLDDVLQVGVENNARIQVEAHTDSSPIRTAQFPSNDHLAAARAVAVIEYFLGREPGLAPERLEAIPLGATRPLSPEVSEAARRRNRRVELIFSAAPADYRR